MSIATKANGIQLRGELVAPPHFVPFMYMLSKEECQGVRLAYLDDDRAHADCRLAQGSKCKRETASIAYHSIAEHTSAWLAHSTLATLRTSPPF